MFLLPASGDLIEGEDMRRDRMQATLSEGLAAVPGLLIQDRQNFAQDEQLSIRGFGSRSTFGVRGIRLYVDGIPATMPDGQGQTSNIDIASIDRVEVLRGPFSALYGNSSGGVVQIFTEDGVGPLTVSPGFIAGSYNQRRYSLKATGATGESPGELGYVLSVNRYSTDGYRDHSDARKTLANAKLTWQPDSQSRFSLILNHVDIRAHDPQGLTYEEFTNSPRSASPGALQFNTRKTVRQTQGGLVYERELNDRNQLRLMTYYGQRSTVQYLGIPVAPQLAPGHAGGVVDLQRDYGGVDLRWTSEWSLAGAPLTLSTGLAYDLVTEDRQGYENFVDGPQGRQLGVKGRLRRDETNQIWNLDPYIQASWEFAPHWTAEAGLRYSTVHFKSDDQYLASGNGDDSGTTRHNKLLPVGALRYQPTENLSFYATAGRGFETPTFNEISYRTDGQQGLNLDLQPSVNDTIEVGSKTRVAGGMMTLAYFRTYTKDEIVTAESQGGRTVYRNAGRTRRQGVELSWSTSFRRHLQARLSYGWLDARYRDSFYDGAPIPENLIPGGNRIAGTAAHAAYASLDWAPPEGWRAGVEGRYLSKLYVNDRNDATAPSYFVAGAHVGYRWQGKQWQLDAFGRLNNLFDRHYAGSAIVNQGQGRYYEPAPGRNWVAGISAGFQF